MCLLRLVVDYFFEQVFDEIAIASGKGSNKVLFVIGMVVLSVVLAWVSQNKITQQRSAILENGVLYWHLVDVIWIFLFPLFYLIS